MAESSKKKGLALLFTVLPVGGEPLDELEARPKWEVGPEMLGAGSCP